MRLDLKHLPASAEIPYGSPVRATRRGLSCAIATTLADMIGVARRGGRSEHGYVQGEVVEIQRNHGIKTVLAADADLTIAGVMRRLLASEPHYFQLQDGRIVG